MDREELDLGFGVSITPTTRTERGLEYSDYKIINILKTEKEVKDGKSKD